MGWETPNDPIKAPSCESEPQKDGVICLLALQLVLSTSQWCHHLSIMSIMSAGHVFARPTVFITIPVFTLLLSSTSEVDHYSLNRCTLVRQFLSLSQQGKLPISKWSKHGQTTIAMPDNQCFVAFNAILLCGDIHPQPGPTAQAERGSKETTIQAAKSHASHVMKNRKHLMSVVHLNVRFIVLHENFHLLKQLSVPSMFSLQFLIRGWTLQYVMRI